MVLRYHFPNIFKDPEGYAYQLLFMFYPFWDECEKGRVTSIIHVKIKRSSSLRDN